jgi:hypothetical protein
VIYSYEDLFHIPLPGLYPACTRFWRSTGWALPAHYRSDHFPQWNISAAELQAERDLLFSFVGDFETHPIRRKLSKLSHPKSSIMNASSDARRWWDRSWEEQVPFKENYREHIIRSKFVLCPRGRVASSIRLFEALEAGAVPVVIADGLVLPEGPAWDEFIVRIPERNIRSIPSILEATEPHASKMGAAAREAWEACFSPHNSFESLLRWGMQIQNNIATMPLIAPRIWAKMGSAVRRIHRKLSNLRSSNGDDRTLAAVPERRACERM